MRNAYPYPLPMHALADFCHPNPEHQLGKPVLHDGEVIAGNGFIAIRARRGAWLDSDFDAATPDLVERFERLPWQRLRELACTDERWRPADEHRAAIFKRGRVGLWTQAGAAMPSPVWMVADRPVRLSLLQLVAMTPRSEIYTGPGINAALLFRFSGGIGIIARDRACEPPAAMISKTIFAPRRCPVTGTRIS